MKNSKFRFTEETPVINTKIQYPQQSSRRKLFFFLLKVADEFAFPLRSDEVLEAIQIWTQ